MQKRQFTLRSMLWRVTIFAIALAIISGAAKWQLGQIQQRRARAALYRCGGMTGMASAQAWLREGERKWSQLGMALFNYIEYVDLSVNSTSRVERLADGQMLAPVDDDVTELLLRFDKLKQLNLRGSQVTDSGLIALSRLPDLEKLDISGNNVTQSGISQFREQRPDCELINDPNWTNDRSPLCLNYWLTKNLAEAEASE